MATDATLAKGLSVLDWLVRQQRPCRASEVAQVFDLARSNAHRTLQTLVSCGWVMQNAADSTYTPSLRLFELGTLVDAVTDLRTVLLPHLASLAQLTGETIHLAVLDGAEIVYLHKFDSPLPVAAYSRVGGRAPAACVASGKALLAALQEDETTLRKRLGRLQAHTPRSLTRYAELLAELQRTRERGLAENREEWRLGVCGLGAAVFNATHTPVAAVGISVPSIRFSRTQVRELAAHLTQAASAASRSLGYTPAQPAPPTSAAAARADSVVPLKTANRNRRQA